MAKGKKNVRPFTVNTMTEKNQLGAGVFNVMKKENFLSIKGIADKASVPGQSVAEYISACVKKDLLQLSSSPKGDIVKFNEKYGTVLGIGFSGAKCFMSAMDLGGNVVSKENTEIGLLAKWKGKNKEVAALVDEIGAIPSLKDKMFTCVGVAVPEAMGEANSHTAEMLAEGVGGIFNCDTYTCNAAPAAAYGERDALPEARGRDILYLHSDIGNGVVIRKEIIFEALEHTQGKGEAYLAPWKQFSIVETAKDLVNKGLGTDIVNIVNGDIEAITLDIVLQAAESGDELADDLVRRAGLALGVRAAYLVNIFGATTVMIGGGAEKKEGGFIKYVKESQERFLLEELRGEVEVISCTLGKEAPSVGAAALCRRELFMEV